MAKSSDNLSKETLKLSILSSYGVETPSRKLNYKNELIFYFFNCMLDCIIDNWETSTVIENVESIYSGHNIPDSKEQIFEAETDEEERASKVYSFFQSSQDIDNVANNIRNSITSDVKKRRSKTFLRKRSTKKLLKPKKYKTFYPADDLYPSENLNTSQISDNSWIIEPLDESVIITFKNGNKYEGSVSNKLMHGYGTFLWADGTKYTGDFENGKITGHGELALPDLSHYTGDFLHNYRHGEGTMSVSGKGAIFRGDWYAGLKHGRGWQLFGPNDWYDGEWYQDTMSGNGIRQYASGARYKGQWREGRRHGKGCAVIKNNDYYSGEWHCGNRKGYGEYTWNSFFNKTFSVPVQTQYFGSWNNNEMDGVGMINFGMDGDGRYGGCFKNNKKHGPGAIICENGQSIVSDPLFNNDKPVHVSLSGSFKIPEENIDSEPSKDNLQTSFISAKRNFSIFKFITNQIYLPTSKLNPSFIANVELCELAFPKHQENYLSLTIPINTPNELIVINHYLEKIYDIHITSNPEISEDTMKSILALEEKHLRNIITMHLAKLRSIYKQYAAVACLKPLPFKARLIRLFLWQFYRDCKIPHKGLSLYQMDEILAKNPDVEFENPHNPFEVIYFWQFLHSLVTVAINLYGKESVKCTREGILKTCFGKFLENDIFPNTGHHIGAALFDYVDAFPLNATYKWFKSFGEPFTALQFLRSSCTIKNKNPSSHNKKQINIELLRPQMGINAYPNGYNIEYLEDELPNIRTDPLPKKIKAQDRETYGELYFLRSLGAKTVISFLNKICPLIIKNNEIANMTYELTFLEFYEVVLLCIQEILDQERIRKEKEKIAQQLAEEQLKNASTVSTSSLKKLKNSTKMSKRKIQMT